MPLSTTGDRRKNLLDKLLELRDYSATALAATTNGTPVTIDATKIIAYEAVCKVAAYTGYVDPTAQWDLKVQVSADNVTYVDASVAYVLDGTEQKVRFALSGAAVNDLAADALYVRTVATKTGAPGDLTYGAFLSPC